MLQRLNVPASVAASGALERTSPTARRYTVHPEGTLPAFTP